MPRPKHYSPEIERFLVSCLYHEARERRIPMTRLVNELLRQALDGSTGWRRAETTTEEAHRPDAAAVKSRDG